MQWVTPTPAEFLAADAVKIALAVIQHAGDNLAVDVAFEELYQHFLADARNKLAAPAIARTALRYAHPAEAVAMDFIIAVVQDGTSRAVGMDRVGHDVGVGWVGLECARTQPDGVGDAVPQFDRLLIGVR